jgi:hypothetical protein
VVHPAVPLLASLQSSTVNKILLMFVAVLNLTQRIVLLVLNYFILWAISLGCQ